MAGLIDNGNAAVILDLDDTDFAAALKMLAMLPLSDVERTEAVRRLLAEARCGR